MGLGVPPSALKSFLTLALPNLNGISWEEEKVLLLPQGIPPAEIKGQMQKMETRGFLGIGTFLLYVYSVPKHNGPLIWLGFLGATVIQINKNNNGSNAL